MLSVTAIQIRRTRDSRRVCGMARAAGDQRATYMQRDFAMLDLEGTTQFLSFFIVAAARQKGRLYAVPKQVKHAYQHFGGGHSGAGHQRKQTTYIPQELQQKTFARLSKLSVNSPKYHAINNVIFCIRWLLS